LAPSCPGGQQLQILAAELGREVGQQHLPGVHVGPVETGPIHPAQRLPDDVDRSGDTTPSRCAAARNGRAGGNG
jgi:hypothetical protein